MLVKESHNPATWFLPLIYDEFRDSLLMRL